MPGLPHSLSGRVPLASKRHVTVMLCGLPGTALHTVSEGPSGTRIAVDKTVRSFRTEFPWRNRAPHWPRLLRSPNRGWPPWWPAIPYLISTFAPASSNFFLMAAASSLFTPSFTVFGAPSTRSFASFRPRLVTSRTALITLILLPPTSVSTTVNSVFSSTGAAPAAAPPPPPAATTVAAAADTPKVSSIFFTRSDASRSVRPLISSRIVSTFDMTTVSPLKFLNQNLRNCGGRGPLSPKPLRTKLVGLYRFANRHRQVPRQGIQRRGDPLCRGVQEEHDLADQLFPRRHFRQLLDLSNRDHLAFHHAGLELKRRYVLGNLRQRLRQRHRIGLGVGNRVRSLQVLQHSLGCSSRACQFGERVLHHLVLSARRLHRPAQLRVVFDRNALEGRQNHRRHLRQFGLQIVQILLLFAFLLHVRLCQSLPALRGRR